MTYVTSRRARQSETPGWLRMSSAPKGGSPGKEINIIVYRCPERAQGDLLFGGLSPGFAFIRFVFHAPGRTIGNAGHLADPRGTPVQRLDRLLVFFEKGEDLRGREADEEPVSQYPDPPVGAPHDVEDPVCVGSPRDDDPCVPFSGERDFSFDPVVESVLLFHEFIPP